MSDNRVMTRAHVEAFCVLSGVKYSAIWDTSNLYWKGDNSIRGPWWLINTAHGVIRVGWRKRVVEIDWTQTGLKINLRVTDQVTQTESMIHAWCYGDVVRYLGLLWCELERTTPGN